MREMTFTADTTLIEAAELRAEREGRTLEDAILEWLADYAKAGTKVARFDATMDALQGKLSVGRKLSRDEMNER